MTNKILLYTFCMYVYVCMYVCMYVLDMLHDDTSVSQVDEADFYDFILHQALEGRSVLS